MLQGPSRINQGDINKFACSLVTGYSNQHFSVSKIFKRYWNLLKNDKVLGPVLPDQPVVIFRGAPSLRHRIAPNVVNPPKTISFFQSMKGFYPCRKCEICHINSFRGRRCESFQSTQTNKLYNIESFITCSTECVVYMIQCPCSKQYIGRTKRALQVRLSEHIGNIKRGFSKHNLSRHYAKYHNKQLKGTLFVALDRLQPHWRGVNKVRAISRCETKWIFLMKSYVPLGLNVDWDINCFINNS